MNKKQLRQFKKITKGTKMSPTLVVINWSVWYSLPYKIQQSNLRTIVVLSEKEDWCENTWTCKSMNEIMNMFGMVDDNELKVVVVGDSDHINAVVNNNALTKKCQTTIFDTDMDDDPYELILL